MSIKNKVETFNKDAKDDRVKKIIKAAGKDKKNMDNKEKKTKNKKDPAPSVSISKDCTVKELRKILSLYPSDTVVTCFGDKIDSLRYVADSNVIDITAPVDAGKDDPCESCENSKSCQEQESHTLHPALREWAEDYIESDDKGYDNLLIECACLDLGISSSWFKHLLADIAGSSPEMQMDESIYQTYLKVMGFILMTDYFHESQSEAMDVDTLNALRKIENAYITTRIHFTMHSKEERPDGTRTAEELTKDDVMALMQYFIPVDNALSMHATRKLSPWYYDIKFGYDEKELFKVAREAYEEHKEIVQKISNPDFEDILKLIQEERAEAEAKKNEAVTPTSTPSTEVIAHDGAICRPDDEDDDDE